MAHIDASVLMELPQLYEYGRKGKWFGMIQFIIYMFDGIVQVCSSSQLTIVGLEANLSLNSLPLFTSSSCTHTSLHLREPTDGRSHCTNSLR